MPPYKRCWTTLTKENIERKSTAHHIATDTGHGSFMPYESQPSLSTGVGSWVYLPSPISVQITAIIVLQRERGGE